MGERKCQYTAKEPVYIKQLGNFVIDPSEYETPEGAFFRYKEISCQYIADPGHRYCPRHEMELAAK